MIDLTKENLKSNSRVTVEHKKDANGQDYDMYTIDVDGPINNHKPPKLTSLLTNLEDNTQVVQPILI